MKKFGQDTIGVQRKNSMSDVRRMEQFLEEVLSSFQAEDTEIVKAEVMRELDTFRELHAGSMYVWYLSWLSFFYTCFLHVCFILF